MVATVDAALRKQGQTLEAVERWKAEMPTEAEMLPKDKYTMFDRKAKRYRKGIHSTIHLLPLPYLFLLFIYHPKPGMSSSAGLVVYMIRSLGCFFR